MLNIPEGDAVVIGAGPNGLAAAIVLAQAGLRVTLIERSHQIGGSVRSAELTLPGFTHDICASVFPLGVGSPFFRTLPLQEHGLEWIHPDAPLAHPLDNGAVALERSLDATAAAIGHDGPAWRDLMSPLAQHWNELAGDLLAPLRWPRHPFALAKFGMNGVRSAWSVAQGRFFGGTAKALFAGNCAHCMMPLEHSLSASFGIILAATAHAVGWPFPKGGAQRLADALASYLSSLGGQIVTGVEVTSLDQLPPAKAVLCDLTPRQLLKIAGNKLPNAYCRKLEQYRYGPGVFKIDWALSAPIPWRDAQCLRAGTVHVGGTIEEIARSEREVWNGRPSERPFVLLAQHSLFDPTRAPSGRHTAWAYCHVPNGSEHDMTTAIESQVERFAPGFREVVLARHTMNASEMEAHNPNLIGGDINAGVPDLPQLLARPTRRLYSTPVKGLYLCSAATPPGGGVHGMCGYLAAKLALGKSF
ncbi:MAG: phytoene desaturase family protein [Terriglobales bacterium]